MNTLTNAYSKKISSGLLLALLALSGILVLLPVGAPALAASVTNPTYKINTPAYAGGEGFYLDFNVTNPTGNSAGVSELTITAPSGWTFTTGDCYYDELTTFLDECSVGGTAATFYADSSGLAIPPGQTQEFEIYMTAATCSTYPCTGTFTTSWEDNSLTFHTGNSFKLISFDPNASVALTPSTTQTFIAGSSAISFSANIGVADAGVPVIFNSYYESGAFSGSGVTVLDPFLAIAYTNTAGIATATFTPSNAEGTDYVYATIGGGAFCWGTFYIKTDGYPYCDDYYWSTADTEVTTVPAAPTSVLFSINAVSFPTSSTHYISDYNAVPNGGSGNDMAYIAAGTLNVSASDRFGNAIAFTDITNANVSVSTTAAGGLFDNGAGANKTTIYCPAGVECTEGGIGYDYYQSGTYGSVGVLTATVRGSINSAAFTVSGSSGKLVTSTFDTVAEVPTFGTGDVVGGNAYAGATVLVKVELSPAQVNVPVTIYMDTATSTQVNGDGTLSALALTASNGTAVGSFKLDTGAGAILYYQSNIPAPTDGAPTSTLGNSTDSAIVNTVPGAAAELVVNAYYDSTVSELATHAVNGTILYIDISLADKYGNPTTNTFNYQIQIGLSGPGSFSATGVYIASGQPDTNSSFGAILWRTPNAFAPETIKAASIFPTAMDTVTLVSSLPTISVTSPAPYSGVIYSQSTAVTFIGQANASLGYPASAMIASVGYKVDGGSWSSAGIASANQVTWSVSISLTAGLHTVQFNATDDQAPSTITTSVYKVLVDPTSPDVNFVTVNNANLSAGQSVSANIVDSMGDLNTSAVSATATNLDTLATSTLTVGSITTPNVLGHSVTYPVSISGLTTGNWSVTLSATNLALNSNSSTITVHVTVPIAQSFVIVGTPGIGTLGGYTGINVQYQNLGPDPSVVIFAVWKNNVGQTVGIGASSATFGPGQTLSAFIVEPIGIAAGSYSVSLFVVTTGNQPVSVSTPISVTV